MPEGIQDALLIYNPTSGGRRQRRFMEIEQAVRILKDFGITTEIAATTAAGSAQGIGRQGGERSADGAAACWDSEYSGEGAADSLGYSAGGAIDSWRRDTARGFGAGYFAERRALG